MSESAFSAGSCGYLETGYSAATGGTLMPVSSFEKLPTGADITQPGQCISGGASPASLPIGLMQTIDMSTFGFVPPFSVQIFQRLRSGALGQSVVAHVGRVALTLRDALTGVHQFILQIARKR